MRGEGPAERDEEGGRRGEGTNGLVRRAQSGLEISRLCCVWAFDCRAGGIRVDVPESLEDVEGSEGDDGDDTRVFSSEDETRHLHYGCGVKYVPATRTH